MPWWEAYQWYCVLCTSATLLTFFLVGLHVHATNTIKQGRKLTMFRTLYLIGMTIVITFFWIFPVIKGSIEYKGEKRS